LRTDVLIGVYACFPENQSWVVTLQQAQLTQPLLPLTLPLTLPLPHIANLARCWKYNMLPL
ncbi:MAG: hypothetical protein MI674_04570, partial [Cytophagales bacterium]|nr:hypothetical protein [Cytophagales bacterium]